MSSGDEPPPPPAEENVTNDDGQGDSPQPQPQPQQQQLYEYYYEIDLPYWLLAALATWLAVLLAAGCYIYQLEYGDSRGTKAAFGVSYAMDDHANPPARSLRVSAAELTARLGADNARLFALLDRDGNGLVSMVEFEALAHHIKQDAGHPAVLQVAQDWLQPRCNAANGDKQCVRLSYRLTPPQPTPPDSSGDSADRFVPYLRYDPRSNSLATVVNASAAAAAGKPAQAVAAALASLTGVSTEASVSAVTIATAFLPQRQREQQLLRVGQPYTLIGPASEGMEFFLGKQRRISPGVYFEPVEIAMATLLRPLHPNVFLYPRHGHKRDSAVAVLRAESASHLDVLFRLQPELQLANFSTQHSVYLTPPSLEGRLVVRRDSGAVELLQISPVLEDSSGQAAALAEHWHLESPHDIVETGQVVVPHLSIGSVGAEQQADKLLSAFNNWTTEVSTAEALAGLRSRTLPHLAASFHGNLSSAARQARLEAGDVAKPKAIHVVLAVGGPHGGCDPNCRLLRDLAFASPLVLLRLRHYYVNAWINLADSAAVAEFLELTGGTVPLQPPLSGHLLDARTLRAMPGDDGDDGGSSFGLSQLRKALTLPEDLPSPVPPMPEAVASGEAIIKRSPLGLTSASSAAAEPDDDHQQETSPPPPPPDPAQQRQQEQEALDTIREQLSAAYMRFLRSTKA